MFNTQTCCGVAPTGTLLLLLEFWYSPFHTLHSNHGTYSNWRAKSASILDSSISSVKVRKPWIPIPDAPCMAYLPTKLGGLGGLNVGKYISLIEHLPTKQRQVDIEKTFADWIGLPKSIIKVSALKGFNKYIQYIQYTLVGTHISPAKVCLKIHYKSSFF